MNKTVSDWIKIIFLILSFSTGIVWSFSSQKADMIAEQAQIDARQDRSITRSETLLEKNTQEHEKIETKLDKILDILYNEAKAKP